MLVRRSGVAVLRCCLHRMSTMSECEPPAPKKLCQDAVVEEVSREDVLEGEGLQDASEGGPRFGKRRKFGVLLSYSGKGYQGMQKNPGVPTIEQDLLIAMRKALAFPPSMENDLGKLQFQRCARTDKGVSAARQFVSIKMVELDDPVTLINAHLPAQIRVMAVKRVTRSFDSRHACDARMYEYVLPTYAFAPYHLSTANYRIQDSTVEQVDRLLQRYVGTRNYHNFTSGKKYSDMSSNRYVMSFKCGERFIGGNLDNSKQMEFISLRVKGQSFVLHQIRKMVGFVVATVCGHVKEEEFDVAFQEDKFDIPKAPALGLLLENVYFERYNARFCNSGERARLEWDDLQEQVQDFKRTHIYRTIIETELKEMAMVMCSMMQWLHSLRLHNFYETAERLKSADSATVGNGDIPPDSPSQQVGITAGPSTGDPTVHDADCHGKDVQTKLEPHPLQSES